jgi:MFS family permease
MSPAHRWLVLGVCTLSFMQTHIHRVGFAPLIPIFIAELGITYTAAGTIMTAYFWTYTAVQVPIGIMTDRFGARRVMLAFMAVLLLGVGVFALSGSYAQALVGRCLVGLGAAAVWLPGLRLINEWFPPEERGRVTGIFSSGGGIGATAALLGIPLLADRFGWRVGYSVTLIPALLALAAIFFVIRPGPLGAVPGPPRQVAGRSAVAPVDGGGGALAQLGGVLGTPALWTFNLAVLFSYGAYLSLVTWLPAFLVRSEGLSRSTAGLVTALMTAGTIISWPVAGFLSDRLRRRKAVWLFSQGMSVPVCLAFAFVVPGSGVGGAMTVAVLTGLVLGGMVTPFVMVAELFPPHLVGTASGVVNTFTFVGALVIPVLLGAVLDASGSFPAAFVACAGVQGLALLTACFTREAGRSGRAMVGTPS